MQSDLREQLLAELRAQGDPQVLGNGIVFDQYEHANKGNLGFYERLMAGEKLPTGWVNPTDFEKPASSAAPARRALPRSGACRPPLCGCIC